MAEFVSTPNTTIELIEFSMNSQPPEPVFSDYVEMVYLFCIIIIGTPLNIQIFLSLLFQLRKTPKNSVKRSFLLLKINLNISDLLIIMIQAVGKLLWLLTYEWKGGELLCRLFEFSTMFTLYLSSNIIVCIAFDRLRTVLAANKIRQKSQSQITRFLITMAWALALIWSIPQLFVWRTYNVFAEHPSGWIQCTEIWSIYNHEKPLNMTTKDPFPYNESTQLLYNISHLILVFYGPLLMLIISYLIIATKLMHYSISDPHISSQQNGVCSVLKPSHEAKTLITSNHGLIEPDDISHLSTTRSLMELNPRTNNDLLHAQPRHSTISAYVRKSNRRSEDIESTMLGVELATVDENKEECEQTKTLIGAIRDLKNELGYCACKEANVQKDETKFCPETDSMTRSASQMLSSSPPFGLNAKIETTTVLSHGGSLESSHLEGDFPFPSRSHSAISGALRRIRRRRKSSAPNGARLPAWRRQLRSRVFRTTLAIILAHVLFWLPYNVYALTQYISKELYERLNIEANIFKELQILIVCVNPFLYGFANGT